MREDISNTWGGKAILITTKTGHVVISRKNMPFDTHITSVYDADYNGVVKNWTVLESKDGDYLEELCSKYEHASVSALKSTNIQKGGINEAPKTLKPNIKPPAQKPTSSIDTINPKEKQEEKNESIQETSNRKNISRTTTKKLQ